MSLPFIIIAVIFLGVLGFLAYMILGKTDSVHSRLAQLEVSHGISESTNPLARFVNEQQEKILGVKFAEAGWYEMTAVKFLSMSLVGGGIGVGIAIVCAIFLHMNVVLVFLLGTFTTVVGFYYPNFGLNAAIKKRKLQIYRSLPDFLDMVASTVEAGIALNGAIAVAADALEGALAEELRAALQDIRLGRSRSEALMAMAQRAKEENLTSAVMSMVQADKLGGNIAQVLEQLSGDAREARLMRAEELSNALPNKLVFPMAFFMLPSLFVIIFGALAAKLINHIQ